MEYLRADRSKGCRLRVVYDDRVVVVPIRTNATVGAVAQMVRGLGAADRGEPVAIEVRMPASGASVPSHRFYPAAFQYPDTPMAAFEDLLPPNARSFRPTPAIGLGA